MPTNRKIEHSQNFIRQSKTVRDLLALSNIGLNDLVVEIGPGRGIITKELLKYAGRVIAIEQDERFIKELLSLDTSDQLDVVVGDFIDWELPQEEFKVFSNIPFNYTADIVNRLTMSDSPPTEMYLIMQEEAAHRFVGMPYHKNSLASVLVAINFSVRILTEIERDCFEPVPGVNIVFLNFSRHSERAIQEKDLQLFRDFVVYGYTQWAPTVLDAFRAVFTKRQSSIIAKSQRIKDLKPSDLTIEQWIGLFRTFQRHVDESKRRLVYGKEKDLKSQQSNLEKSYRTRYS